MRKIYKKVNIVLILILILGTSLCPDSHVFASEKVYLRPTSIFKPIYKRDEKGNLVLVEYPDEPGNVITAKKGIYFFSQGKANGDARSVFSLGIKGANLAEMSRMGLPIPPGFTIATEITNQLSKAKELPPNLREDIERYIKIIERDVDYRFGSTEKPLLLSVRGGAECSMPGFLGTVTNIGLNDETVEGLARLSRNRHFAYASYIRFILDYGQEVLGIEYSVLEDVIQEELNKSGLTTVDSASVETLISLAKILKLDIKKLTNKDIPKDPFEQLANSIMAVIKSWDRPEAVKYRDRNSIPHDIGIAVNVQAMVFGNLNENSGTGVAFTRNPLNGEREVFGEILFNAQGKDIVSGKVTPLSLGELDRKMPLLAQELREYLEILEKRFKEIQDVEFSIQDGKLYILQTRGNESKVTPLARARILMDLAQEGIISEEEALKRINLIGLLWLKKYLETPILNPEIQKEVLVTGIPASPGIVEGRVFFDKEKAISLSQQGEPVILVLNESFPWDEEAVKACDGTLTRLGGATSHAAIIARGSETIKPVITGANGIQFAENGFRIGDIFVKEGDFIVLDGNSGKVYKGRIEESDLMDSEITRVIKGSLAESESKMFSYYKKLLNWIDMKEEDEASLVFIKKEKILLEARAVVDKHLERWREEMGKVTRRLLGIAKGTSDRDDLEYLSYKETALVLRYIYKEDAQVLAMLIHAQGLRHVEFLEIFNHYIDVDFGTILFSLLARFNVGDFTSEEYDDFLMESKFPIIRLLIGLENDAHLQKYLEDSSKETLASVIEESVRFINVYRDEISRRYDRIASFGMEAARSICKRIAERIYDDRETRNFLFGTQDSRGRLTQMASKWFNKLVEEISKERLEQEKKKRAEETSASSVRDMQIPREDYPEEFSDRAEELTHAYYAYYGGSQKGEIDYVASKISEFSRIFSQDDPETIEHMRQYLEYAFADDEDYYSVPAFNLFFFSYLISSDAEVGVMQKVFSVVSPKIVVRFLNFAAIVDEKEKELIKEFSFGSFNIEKSKKQFFRNILTVQSKERIDRIRPSLTPEALTIADSLEKEIPNLREVMSSLKDSQKAVQTGN